MDELFRMSVRVDGERQSALIGVDCVSSWPDPSSQGWGRPRVGLIVATAHFPSKLSQCESRINQINSVVRIFRTSLCPLQVVKRICLT